MRLHRDRPYSKVVILESKAGVQVHFYRRLLYFFWFKDITVGLYPSFAACLMGLAEKYLQAAKRRGAAGRKERRRLAKKVAQRLAG